MIKHGEESEEEARIFTGEYISLEDTDPEEDIYHAEEDAKTDEGEEKKKDTSKDSEKEETVEDILDTFNEKQKKVLNYVVGRALEDSAKNIEKEESDDEENEGSKGGNETMKHNVFDGKETENQNVLSHADQESIISLAKQSNVGSLKQAMDIYAEENALAHGIFENYEVLFPEYELLRKGEPETLEKYNKSWVGPALAKIHKSPFSRIRTRQADARIADLRAKG